MHDTGTGEKRESSIARCCVMLQCWELVFYTSDLDTTPKTNGWNLKITCLKRNIIFQTSIFRFHVSLPGCTHPETNSEFTSENWPFVPKDPLPVPILQISNVAIWCFFFQTVFHIWLRISPSILWAAFLEKKISAVIDPLCGGFSKIWEEINSLWRSWSLIIDENDTSR